MDRNSDSEDEERDVLNLNLNNKSSKKRPRIESTPLKASAAEIDFITIDSTTDDSNSNGKQPRNQPNQAGAGGGGGLQAEPICFDCTSAPSTPTCLDKDEIVVPRTPHPANAQADESESERSDEDEDEDDDNDDNDDNEEDDEEKSRSSEMLGRRLDMVGESMGSLPDIHLTPPLPSRSSGAGGGRISGPVVVETITLSSSESPEDSNASDAASRVLQPVRYTAATFDANFDRTGMLRDSRARAGPRKRGRSGALKAPIVRDRNNNEMMEFDDDDDDDASTDVNELELEPVTSEDASASITYLITPQTVANLSFRQDNRARSNQLTRELSTTSLRSRSGSAVTRLSRSQSKISVDASNNSLEGGLNSSQRSKRTGTAEQSKQRRRESASSLSSAERASTSAGRASRMREMKSVSTPERGNTQEKRATGVCFKQLSLSDIKLADFKPIVKLARIEDDVYEFYQSSWQREKERKSAIDDVFGSEGGNDDETDRSASMSKTPTVPVLDRNLMSAERSLKKKKKSSSSSSPATATTKPRRIEPPELFDENTNFFNDDNNNSSGGSGAPVVSPILVKSQRKLKLTSKDDSASLPSRAGLLSEKTTTPVAAESPNKSLPTPNNKSSTTPTSASKTTTPPTGGGAAKRIAATDESAPPASKKLKLADALAASFKSTPTVGAKTVEAASVAPNSATTIAKVSSGVKQIKLLQQPAPVKTTLKPIAPKPALAASGGNRTSTPAPAQPVQKTTTTTGAAKACTEPFKIPKIAKATPQQPAPEAKKTSTTSSAPTQSTAAASSTELKVTKQVAKVTAPAASAPSEEKKKTKTKKTTTNNDNNTSSVQRTSTEEPTMAKVLLETSSTIVTRSMATSEPVPAPTLDLFRQQYLNQPVTISQHHERRSSFNAAIKCAHPFFNFGYLIMEYLNQVTLVSSLDFDFLIKTCPQEPGDELSVRSLAREQQIELCRLMSRNAGRLNYYRILGFGADFRQPKPAWPHNNQLVQQYHALTDNHKKIELILSNLASMTLAEAYALYCAYQTKLASPYRQINVFHNPEFACKSITSRFGKFDIKIETQNDGCVLAGPNASIEELVMFALHKKNEYSLDQTIRASLSKRFADGYARDEGDENYSDEDPNAPMTYDAKIKKAQELINDKHTFDNLYVNSVFQKNTNVKCPSFRDVAARNLTSANYIEQCKNGQIKPPRISTTEVSRFANYKAITNENRGDMQKANKFRILTSHETQRIMNDLQGQQDFRRLNISALFNHKKRA